MTRRGRHAIVIGAGMGGLLAARALADHFDEVTVLERDALLQSAEPRNGVPQGRHAHSLLARGREVLDQLFPGLSEDMVAQGALYGDVANDVFWFNYGFYLKNARSALRGLLISRPLLEAGVRRRLVQLPNVQVCERWDAAELLFDRAEGRVAGVRANARGGAGPAETLVADLVVDASGRGSRSPGWLHALGYDQPREDNVEVDIGYTTRQYRRRPGELRGKLAAVVAAYRPNWRFGAILAQEDDRWIVTLGGYLGDQAPTDEPGFLRFARSLATPEIFDVVRNAEPLSPLTADHFSASLRRRYEELANFPEGFVVFGDALCSFNPIYGQGMTVACMEALALRDCVAAGTRGLGRRFFKAASRLIDIPWQIAVGSDLQHPQVQAERTARVRLINWYIAKLYHAAACDPVLSTRFLEVVNLTKTPPALLDPRIAWRVLRGNWARGRMIGERYSQVVPAK